MILKKSEHKQELKSTIELKQKETNKLNNVE